MFVFMQLVMAFNNLQKRKLILIVNSKDRLNLIVLN